MRVAIFTETFLPKIDGIVRVATLTLEHLHRHSVEVAVIAPDQGMKTYAGAQVIGAPCVRNPVYPEGRIGLALPSVWRRVKAFRPDLIHSFHPVNLGMAGVIYGKWLRVPVISSFHLDIAHMASFYGQPLMGEILRRMVRWGFNHSTYSLAPSKLVQEKMSADGIKRVGLWRRGVDAEQFHPRYRSEAVRAQISGGHPEDRLLLYVGRLAPEKQLEQLRPVLEQIPGTRLVLVGGGPHREALEAHFAGLPVTFAGYRTGRGLAEAYASADIFVFPSAFESFGLVMLEAMASGLPVITARVGGAKDVIQEGVNGASFAVDDTAALIDGVRQFVGEAALQSGRMAARQTAERFAWPVIMDELYACYQAVLAGQPSPI